jgi:hypothetical protein
MKAEQDKIDNPMRPVVPVESAECQTDIGMDYFDRPPSFQKQDSRGSATGSNK